MTLVASLVFVVCFAVFLFVLYQLGYWHGYHHAVVDVQKVARKAETDEIEKLDSDRLAALADYKKSTMGLAVDLTPSTDHAT